jgi:hypothetical protein
MAEEQKTFFEDASLIDLANKVIKQERLTLLDGVAIKYVFVAPEISRTVHARCMRGNRELRHFGEFDFLIEFSHGIWQKISEQTREILMYHEMLHALVTQDKKGKTIYKIARHDIMDFSAVISKYGIGWFTEYKNSIGEIYEMTAQEKDQIQI